MTLQSGFSLELLVAGRAAELFFTCMLMCFMTLQSGFSLELLVALRAAELFFTCMHMCFMTFAYFRDFYPLPQWKNEAIRNLAIFSWINNWHQFDKGPFINHICSFSIFLPPTVMLTSVMLKPYYQFCDSKPNFKYEASYQGIKYNLSWKMASQDLLAKISFQISIWL